MLKNAVKLTTLFLLFGVAVASAEDRAVDPTFLYRNLADVPFQPSDLTTDTCRYRPLFGEGDKQTSIVRGVARYGELVVGPNGECKTVKYENEEQIFYVAEGQGELVYRGEMTPVRKGDFAYFAPTSEHSAANHSSAPLRLIVMGFKTPKDLEHGVPVKLPVANEAEAKKQVVGNHPASTLYQLLLGDTTSDRDLLSMGHTVTSLFIMEFAPGGTNHPHHHANAEEVYLLLEGTGEMVAGGGVDGVEGRHPAKPGDAYFYRLNATVGFYNDPDQSKPKARILAVRSFYPGMAP
jgi:mannose-6-phosphate isomerase-like protein (cupin superfamily)